MAGIGFALRRLAKQDNLIGLVQAYGHSAFAAAGPWLFTLVSLATIILFASKVVDISNMAEFRTIIIYNFSFSLVMSGPIFMITTRYLADSIHAKDVSNAPSMLIGSLILLYLTQLPLISYFYSHVAKMDPKIYVPAIFNVMLISTIWVVSVFLTALKDYRSITVSFAIGMAAAAVSALYLAEKNSSAGLINGFSIGLSIILALLFGKIFKEYPYGYKKPFAFVSYFSKYWEIALGGLIYNVAIWVDKWIMWFSPEAVITTQNNLPLYPYYDSAMFYAYLTIVPSMALFIFSIETNFFEHYRRFYQDIKNKATLRKIEQNHKSLIESIFGSARNFIFLQGTICIMTIMMAPKIFEMFSINYLQIGIFRFGVLGALFHVLTMFLIILLSYFDNRKGVLAIQAIFLVANASFTWFVMPMGFEYYGYGYFLASLLVFIIAAVLTARYVANLVYHSFITTNTSIK